MSIQLQTYTDFLQQFINNPPHHNQSNQIQQAIACLKELCAAKAQLSIKPIGFWQCAICFYPISLNDQYYCLSCEHCSHQKCIENICAQRDPNLVMENLTQINCNICGYELKPQEAYDGIGKNKLEEIYFQQAMKLDRQLAEENKMQAEAKTFSCSICMDEALSVNRECITLECEHRVCKECLENYLNNLIQNGQVSATELVCPEGSCKEPIEQSIIQYVVSQEIFERYINFGFKNLTTASENQIFVQCPTANCDMIFEYDKRQEETRFVCPVCNKKFCALGCDDPHDGYTCEQYKQWKVENGRADQEFDLILQRDQIKKCPFCGAYVHRNGGCNHMTCRCGKEFCYVCGGPWVGRTCGHSY